MTVPPSTPDPMLTPQEHDTLRALRDDLDQRKRHDANGLFKIFGTPSAFVQTVVVIGSLLWGIFEIRAIGDNNNRAISTLTVKVDAYTERQTDVIERLGRHDERIKMLEQRVAADQSAVGRP